TCDSEAGIFLAIKRSNALHSPSLPLTLPLGARMKRILCRLLVALMIWTPYQFATAGMIGTEQVAPATASSAQADRATVASFLHRGDVTSQLQAMGINPKTAQDRIAALSDQEVQQLAGKINSLPAGASDAGDVALGILIVAVIVVVVWYVWKRM